MGSTALLPAPRARTKRIARVGVAVIGVAVIGVAVAALDGCPPMYADPTDDPRMQP